MGNVETLSTYTIEEMEKYLRDYDVLSRKYFWDIDDVSLELFEQAISMEDRRAVLDRAWDIEQARDTFLNVKSIYDDSTLDHLSLIQLANDKFIGDFVGIEGIGRLFRDTYFCFEWMMHLEYNKEKHDYTYYRDHYIHQIRNMYEMLTLLDEHGFMERCIHIYKKGIGVVAEYIRASVREQIRCADMEEKKFFKKIVKGKNTVTSKISKEDIDDRMEDFYYRYLLHSSSIIAALVHDIGYPINFVLRMTETLHEFLPLSESFLHINDAMPHLEEILQGSLLYKTVDSKQIALRINDKHDHGAVSAVILLSQYYETGAIYHLRPIEKMAVELASLIIYNHTLKYEYMVGKKEELYRNVFVDNPISYLFRLCDDIQEWGRVYFEISKKSNFLLCSVCRMPITKTSEHRAKAEYTCFCGERIDKRTKLNYRKMTHIDACKSVSVRGAADSLTIKLEYDPVTLLQLSYYSPRFAKQRADGLYEVKRMLDAQDSLPAVYVDAFLTNNPIAIKVRCLEKYLETCGKGIYKTVSKMWTEVVDTYILYMQEAEEEEEEEKEKKETDKIARKEKTAGDKRENIKKFAKKFLEKIEGYPGKTWKDIRNVLNPQEIRRSHACAILDQKLQHNLYFYYYLAVVGKYIEDWRREEEKYLTGEIRIGLAELLAMDVADAFGISDRPTRVLIMDYLLLRLRHISQEEFLQCNDPEMKQCYYEMGLSNEFIVNAIKGYVGSDAYGKVKTVLKKSEVSDAILEELKGVYDYYTDYELFSQMAEYKNLQS